MTGEKEQNTSQFLDPNLNNNNKQTKNKQKTKQNKKAEKEKTTNIWTPLPWKSEC